jgi:hypothetical protein
MGTTITSENNTKEKHNRELPGGRHGGDIEGIIKPRLYCVTWRYQFEYATLG